MKACGKRNFQTIMEKREKSYKQKSNWKVEISSFLLLQKKIPLTNIFITLSLAHCIVCSIAAGKDFRVQNGISSSGGSR